MSSEKIRIGFVIYHEFNILDLAGPYEVLSRLDSECFLVSEKVGEVFSEKGISVKADFDFSNSPRFDIVVVTGGPGQMKMMTHPGLMAFLKDQASNACFVAGVCTGSLLLAASGLLQGLRATTHWLAMDELKKFGVLSVRERVVWDKKFITGAGVSAGIDLALELASKIAGPEKAQIVQLAIEYDPAPPFDSGSPEKASSNLVDQLKRTSRFHKGA